MLVNTLRRRLAIANSRGDTIVEVMIVLAILGMAIGIAYETANQSLLSTRQAQENSIATEIAQSQVEGLSAIGCTSDDPSCDPTNPANTSYKLFQYGTAGTVFCLNSANNPVTSGSCNGLSSLSGSSQPSVSITCLNHCATAPYTFEVQVQWDDVLGQGKDTVTQDYVLPK